MERENESAGELESGWEDEGEGEGGGEGEGEEERERGGEGEGEMEEGERDSNFETPSTHKSTETRPHVSVHRRRGRKRRNSSLLGRHGNREGSFPTANDGERERESRGRGRESERNDTVVEASNSVKRTCGLTPDDVVATPTVAVPTARIDRSFGGKRSVFDTSRGSVGSGGREGERGEGEETLIHMSVLLRNGLDSTAGGFHGNSRSLSAANGSKFVGKSKMFNGIQTSSNSWLEGDSPHDTLPSDVLIDGAVDRGACLTREFCSRVRHAPRSTALSINTSLGNVS